MILEYIVIHWIVNAAIVIAAVLIHYEALRLLSMQLPHVHLAHRYRVIIGMFGCMTAHVLEVWWFALFYFLLHGSGAYGALQSPDSISLMDCAYFSFVTYTSLGYGDFLPAGPIRFLAGLEALTGLLMIAWTASFMYYEMERYWKSR